MFPLRTLAFEKPLTFVEAQGISIYNCFLFEVEYCQVFLIFCVTISQIAHLHNFNPLLLVNIAGKQL